MMLETLKCRCEYAFSKFSFQDGCCNAAARCAYLSLISLFLLGLSNRPLRPQGLVDLAV